MHFHFRYFLSTKIVYDRVSRTDIWVPHGYQIISEHFPSNTFFNVYQLAPDNLFRYAGKLRTNQDGELYNGIKPFKDQIMVLEAVMNGSWAGYVLISEDDQTSIGTIANPNPIETRWNNGAYTSILMMSQLANSFLVSSRGHNSEDEIRITKIIDNEESKLSLKCDLEGNFTLQVTHEKDLMVGGQAKIKIENVSTGESRTLKYFWGIQAMENAKYFGWRPAIRYLYQKYEHRIK